VAGQLTEDELLVEVELPLVEVELPLVEVELPPEPLWSFLACDKSEKTARLSASDMATARPVYFRFDDVGVFIGVLQS